MIWMRGGMACGKQRSMKNYYSRFAQSFFCNVLCSPFCFGSWIARKSYVRIRDLTIDIIYYYYHY